MSKGPSRHAAAAPSLTPAQLLAQSPWFALLDADAQHTVQAHVTQWTVPAGQPLSHAGENWRAWFGVLQGWIKWSICNRHGREMALGVQSPGSWFGEGTLIREQPRSSDLVALQESRVACLPLDVFMWLRQNQPGFNDFLLHQINERLHWFMGNVVTRGMHDTTAQVARMLLGLMHPLFNPLKLNRLHLSQEELAKLAAVSRQSCNAALTQFKQAGLVHIEYGTLAVLDTAGLEQLAG